MCPAADKAGERVHQHREERDDGDHGGLGRPVEAEPHHHDRGDADDRQRGDEVSDRQQAAAEEGEAVGDDRHQEPGAAADDVAGQHAAHEGLHEILGERRERAREPRGRRARRRHQDRGNTEAAHGDLPEIEHEAAEQHGDREVEARRRTAFCGLDRGKAGDDEARGEPARQHQGPEAGAGVPGDTGIAEQLDRDDTGEDDAGERQRHREPERRGRKEHGSRERRHEQRRMVGEGDRDAERQHQGGEGQQRRGEIPGFRRTPHGFAPIHRGRPSLGEADDPDEDGREDRRGKQRRPDLQGLAVIGAGEQPRADPGLRPGRQLRDDRPDERDRDRDLEAREQERHRGGQAQLPQHLGGRRRPGAHEVALDRVRRGQPLHHADRHRKEAQIGRDQRFRQQPAQADGTEHHDDDRRDGEDRHHLRADDPGHQALFQHAHMHDRALRARCRARCRGESRRRSPRA